ncbi:hypothetical protein WJX79_009614 [Trebouxia sp. C0005]
MCQLATGSPVAAFFHVQEADVKFEGTLGVYQSSDKAVRKFCTNCGTPLVFQFVADAEKELDIYTTTLDELGRAAPTFHIWMQSKQAWLQLADDLPKYQQERSGENLEAT